MVASKNELFVFLNRRFSKWSMAGILAMAMVVLFAVIGHSIRSHGSVNQSYGTGLISIRFKDDASVEDTTNVLAKYELHNDGTRPDFMQLSGHVDTTVSIRTSPIGEINAYEAKVAAFRATPGVVGLTDGNVSFLPSISKYQAHRLIAAAGITQNSNVVLTHQTTVQVTVPVGQEPKVINKLLDESSVASALEPRITLDSQ